MPSNRIGRARAIRALATLGFLCSCGVAPLGVQHSTRAAVLRSGDRILVYDRNIPELRHLASIRADGLALLPHVGRQFLIGMSEQDAAAALTEAFQQYFQSVEVRVHRVAAVTDR